MKTPIIRTLFIACLFSLIHLASHAQNVFVIATSIKSANGKLIIKIFKDNDSFVKEQPFKEMTFDKKGMVNGVIALSFTVEPGTYGITLLDDENANGKMDNNFVKMPKEGFGFSNFYLEKLQRPHFDDFKVIIKEGKNKVDIKTKYL